MKSCVSGFNIYLALLVLCAGCGTGSGKLSKMELSTMRLYLEGASSSIGGQGDVEVTRQNIPMNIEAEPLLTEQDLRKAAVVDYPDGTFAIQLNFDDHGALVLDMTTTAYRGKHIIVFSQFPKPEKPKDSQPPAPPPEEVGADKPRASGWLAAVLIRNRITSGSFRFTPDASRQEADRIVRGLNNLIAEVAKKSKGT